MLEGQLRIRQDHVFRYAASSVYTQAYDVSVAVLLLGRVPLLQNGRAARVLQGAAPDADADPAVHEHTVLLLRDDHNRAEEGRRLS